MKLDLDALIAEIDGLEFVELTSFVDLNDYQASGQYADDINQIVENLQNEGIETTFAIVEPLFKFVCERYFASQSEE